MTEDDPVVVIGGVDTHKDIHVAAVIDIVGRLLGTKTFPATGPGYRALARWLSMHGEVAAVGVEGTNSWGAGLTRYLRTAGLNVVEVNRPERRKRRQRGKTDAFDAEAAARAVLAGEATALPKASNGPVEALRQLRIARLGAMKARTAAANQMHSLTDTAPEELRTKLRPLSTRARARTASRFRPGDVLSPEGGTKRALASVAKRWLALDEEIRDLDKAIKQLLDQLAPDLVARFGVGYETAGQLLVTAGDNPNRIGSERSLAALCGTSPVPVSSGRIDKHRLNRAGDRHANSALWTIVMVRIAAKHEPTMTYIKRRTADGLSKRDIIRCLKRYVARELYNDLQAIITGADTFERAA